MKKLLILLLAVSFRSLGQVCFPPDGAYLPMVTDPQKVQQLSTPYEPAWRNNKYPWFSFRNTTNGYGADPNAVIRMQTFYPIPNQVYEAPNPFYPPNLLGSAYTKPLRIKTSADYLPNGTFNEDSYKARVPDYLPADGWELIKQDLGYLENDGSGNSLASNQNLNTSSQIPYIMLYNKFSGVLRVMGFHHPDLNTISGNNMLMTVSFRRDGDPSNQTVYSGLFNTYDQLLDPLNEKTNIDQVSTICVFPGTSSFFWGDFQTCYDPCTCIKDAKLYFDFNKFNISQDFTLNGNLLNLNTSPDYDEINKLILSMLTKSASNTAFNPSGNGGYVQFRDIKQANNYYKNLIDAGPYVYKDKIKAEWDEFTGFLDGIASVATAGAGGGLVGWARKLIFSSRADDVKSGLKEFGEVSGFLSKIANFLVSKPGSSSLNAVQRGFSLSGFSVSTEPSGVNTLVLKAPGSSSSRASNGVEFSNTSVAPVYNEILGTFATLQKPVIDYQLKVISEDGALIKRQTTWRINPSSFKFSLNPSLDLLDYNLNAVLEIKVQIKRDQSYIYPIIEKSFGFEMIQDLGVIGGNGEKAFIYQSKQMTLEELNKFYPHFIWNTMENLVPD